MSAHKFPLNVKCASSLYKKRQKSRLPFMCLKIGSFLWSDATNLVSFANVVAQARRAAGGVTPAEESHNWEPGVQGEIAP